VAGAFEERGSLIRDRLKRGSLARGDASAEQPFVLGTNADRRIVEFDGRLQLIARLCKAQPRFMFADGTNRTARKSFCLCLGLRAGAGASAHGRIIGRSSTSRNCLVLRFRGSTHIMLLP
jgi:hypothetical protein